MKGELLGVEIDGVEIAGRVSRGDAHGGAAQTFAEVKELLRIRRTQPALEGGEEEVLHADRDTIVYVRYASTEAGIGHRVLIAVNKGD